MPGMPPATTLGIPEPPRSPAFRRPTLELEPDSEADVMDAEDTQEDTEAAHGEG